MREKLLHLKRFIILALLLQCLVLIFVAFILKWNVVLPIAIVFSEGALIYYLFDSFEESAENQSIGVKNILGASAEEAYLTGGVGIVIYDDDYMITWMSDLFKVRGITRIGERLTAWLPETGVILSGDSDTVQVSLDDCVYEVRRKSDEPVLFFRDITNEYTYKETYLHEKMVIGLANFDNYEESVQYVDESESSMINAAVCTPVTEYCREHGILVKRLNNSRYLLVLNEKIFADLVKDRFSLLSKVRKAAQSKDVSITLSLAFARGTSDLDEMDDMVTNLLDLAQTRGGDQVAVQVKGEDVKYFGGSTEAAEKRSRVRVRVMAHSLRELIYSSSNVIIAGHKNADFDCIGSALCLAKMVHALHKPVCIIAKSGGIEEKLAAAMDQYKKELSEEVTFVTESEALNQLRPSTLVIMTDHHNILQSNGANVEENAKKVVVIDHHRRSTDIGVKPVLIYIEAGASSACELVTEMIPYISNQVDISELVATIMLTGMTIDTDHFHVRTGSRTYDACSVLRQYGADPQMANDFLKDTYDEFNLKSKVVAGAEQYSGGIIIAPYEGGTMTRSLMSQVADTLLDIQGVQAAFVLANSDTNETCISARSSGAINVQAIMEKMHGGGHMTAAAMQRSKTNLKTVKAELINAIEEYRKEEDTNESDS